jgi:hypothetical protein
MDRDNDHIACEKYFSERMVPNESIFKARLTSYHCPPDRQTAFHIAWLSSAAV